jgi:hypothetical protein
VVHGRRFCAVCRMAQVQAGERTRLATRHLIEPRHYWGRDGVEWLVAATDPHSCACHRNPVPRVGAAKESFSAQRLGLGLHLCDIPRASPRTEMREAVVYARHPYLYPCGRGRKIMVLATLSHRFFR